MRAGTNSKTCTRCQLEKPLDEFGSDKQRVDGLSIYCRECIRERGRESYARNAASKRSRSREQGPRCRTAKYGISASEYERILAQQGGTCATCDATPKSARAQGKRLAVDHDHSCCPSGTSCGRCIRGLICASCNWALGQVSDDPEILWRLIAYVIKGRDVLAEPAFTLADTAA